MAVRDWLLAQPPGPERDAWVERAAGSFGWGVRPNGSVERDFELVGPLVLGLPEEAAGQAAIRLAEGLADRDTAAAKVWAKSLPPGPVRARAWEGIGRGGHWQVEDFPAGPDRAAVLMGGALRWFHRGELVENLGYAAQIGDATLRRSVFDEFLESGFGEGTDTSDERKTMREALDGAKVPDAWKRPWQARLNELPKLEESKQ